MFGVFSFSNGVPQEILVRHGCSGRCMLLENKRNYGLGMDALVIACSWNTDGLRIPVRRVKSKGTGKITVLACVGFHVLSTCQVRTTVWT